ncbi:MAG: hypothetical protein KA715_01925 [Xanthomonadaceae bacterium]|nr:hypothetical protein [Xanthomonadaceae bacterium]
MSWEPLILYSIGFGFLMGKRNIIGVLCGLQICAMSMISFCTTGGPEATAICLIILICSGLSGVVGISALSRRELQGSMSNEE